MRQCLRTALGIIFLWSLVRGQLTTAEFTGTVTDSSGGVVANATVTITNVATNVRRTVTTNSAGVYDAPALPPGVYSLRITMPGFRPEALNNVEVQVGQVARLDFTLQVGNVAETVEVTATAAALQTETASVGTVVENRRIEELPLNGRNYLQLASLVPGATTYGPSNSIAQARGGGDRSNFQLNMAGQRLENNHYTLDGIENTDPNYGTYLFQPSVDALQEFKVESGTYNAEYGHNLGQINVVTKSGANQYHGSAWDFLRNSKLDAKNFFDSPTMPIVPFKRNQFGFTLGGPVTVPKIFSGKDRLFFFFNYEGLRQRKAVTSLATVPFPNDRSGNFAGSSTVIYDPDTRVRSADGTRIVSVSPFQDNVIPASRISPVSAALMQVAVPLPNNITRGYANDFLNNEGATADNDQELARVDWAATSKQNFLFRYSHGYEPQYIPAAIPQQGTVNTTVTHQAMLGHTWVLGPNKVNDFKMGMSRLEANNGNLHSFKPEWDYVGKLDIPALTRVPIFYGIPFFTMSQFTGVGDPANGPYTNWDTLIQWSDGFSWNKGKHSFKFGAEIIRTRFNLTGNDVARGRFTFSGTYTAAPGVAPAAQNSVADFLLGYISNAEGQLGEVVANLRGISTGFYFQDQWKLTPRLTINYGLRYEIEPGFHEKYDHLAHIDFSYTNSFFPTWVRAGKGDPLEGNPPFPLPANIPFVRDGRFGRNVFRTDYHNFGPRVGFAYSLNSKTVLRAGGGFYFIHDIGNTMFDIARNQPFTLRIQIPSDSLTPNETWSRPYPVLGVSTLAPDWEWQDPTSYVPQWSASLQRALTKDMSLETAYVGSAGVHLYRTTYYNEPPPGPPGDLNLRRPFPQLGFVQLVNASSHASYHSLQVRLQQRLAHGFTLLSSFSFEKSIDNGSGIRQATGDAYVPSNVNDLRAERGPSAFNFGRRWTTSFLYQLPFGKGRARLGNAAPVVDALLGGWQMGGILTLQGGFPFSVACQSNTTYQNTDTTCRADAVGIDPRLANPDPAAWFNKAAFVNRLGFVAGVGPYRFGNSGRNNVVGPGIVALDFSMAKSFQLTERARLEFRSEFFNLPNHPIFGQPGATVSTVSYAVIGSTRLDSRQLQFGLKLSF